MANDREAGHVAVHGVAKIWGGLRDEQFPQLSPRIASHRKGDVLVSLPYSHFMDSVKWNISCHINKDVTSICDSGLPRCKFLGSVDKQQKKRGGYTKNSRML